MTTAREFWRRVLSPQTARFILSLLALGGSTVAMFTLMADGIDPQAEDAVIFGLGLLFGLAKDSFGYYFGSTARNDERTHKVQIDQPHDEPVPVEETKP